MDEPEVNQHRGSMRRALGTCPGFSETNGDARWPFAPDSRILSGACSPCQGGRQTGFTLESDRLGGLRREAAPAPYTLDSLPTPVHPASRRALSESLEITGRSPILPSHNPEKMNAVALNLGFIPLNVEASPSSSGAQTG